MKSGGDTTDLSRQRECRGGRISMRSVGTRLLAFGFAALLFVLGSVMPARAGVPITLYQSFAGNLDFVGTAGSLRVGSCGTASSGSGTLSGIPSGATIAAAYLYWAGSGATADNTITLATPASGGSTVSADRTFADDFVFDGDTYDFFSGFADVTDLVDAGRNGTYTVSNFTWDDDALFSSVAVCLGGWSLVVIYEDGGEPLRVVNVFDGFEDFRGSAITLNPNNFVVPASPIDGKLGHITWEGDVGNSGQLGLFSESLSFEGTDLFDSDNPQNNEFNSVSSITSPAVTLPGVDFDVYALDSLLSAGQTTGASVYSSGSDRVLLTAEIFSVTNTPVADLSLSKTATTATFSPGSTATWNLTVSSAGPSDDPGPIVVTDVLPGNVTFDSATGSGWSCSESSGTVTCSNPSGILEGASLPPITLDVLVDAGATGSIANSASVAGSLFDNVSGNNTGSASTPLVLPDLSASTKTVVDVNGVEPDPGDVLRYTITVEETSGLAVTGISVTDDLPAGLSGFAVISLPPGATDASASAPNGANGTGRLEIQDIALPASGTAEIIFEVTIDPGLAPGSIISNSALVTPPSGTPGNPSAPDVIVSPSQVASSGIKPLYLGDPASSGRALSRNAPNGLPPTTTLGNVAIDRTDTETWTLSEALAAPLSLSGDDVNVPLWIRKGGTNGSAVSRTVQLSLNSAALGPLATATQTIAAGPAPSELNFTLTPTAALPGTLPAGDVLTLSVTNSTSGGGNRRIRVFPAVAGASGGNSRAELNALTVINVDSVDAYDAPAPGGATAVQFSPTDSVSLRAVVSDPFGAFDIAGAQIEVFDPSGTSVFGPASMAEIVAAQTASTKTFESIVNLTGLGATGNWTVLVTAAEGAEGTITDLGAGSFAVGDDPDLVIFKIVSVLDDPVNGTANPKAIPGANVIYTIGISNQGSGAADDVVIEDSLPAELELYVGDYVTPGPFYFVDGSPASGLAVSFVTLAEEFDDVEFDDGGGLFALEPVPDGDGFDDQVRAFRIRPSGSLSGSSGTPPSFQIRFRARVR